MSRQISALALAIATVLRPAPSRSNVPTLPAPGPWTSAAAIPPPMRDLSALSHG